MAGQKKKATKKRVAKKQPSKIAKKKAIRKTINARVISSKRKKGVIMEEINPVELGLVTLTDGTQITIKEYLDGKEDIADWQPCQ